MTNIFLLIVILAAVTSMTLAQTDSFLKLYTYDDCQGKDAGNYTLHGAFNLIGCDITTVGQANTGLNSYLVERSGHKQPLSVNVLQPLSFATFPAGAYTQEEALWLCISGQLQGKYVYEKTLWIELAYLKKCSSVLGYSYVSSKTAVLLINDKLDMNVLISPIGAYEVFKKGCSTVCNGSGYLL